MKALLIDAVKREVREVEYDGLKGIQTHVGGYIETAWAFENGDTLFVDEEGFLKASEAFFWLQPRGDQPLAGNGLLVGAEVYDGEGEYVRTDDPKTTAAELTALLHFANREEIEAWGEANVFEPSATFTYVGDDGKVHTKVLGTWGDLISDMPKPEGKTDDDA